MCGICGKLILNSDGQVSPDLVKQMSDTIVHRGPDDFGAYVSGPVGFGFRRLSIIDLSGGHQPLCNEDESVWIIFNGEIYNYQELRQFLIGRGHRFRTNSDTETIVHLYEEFGEACVEKLRGMFGFAIWDSRTRSLLLARDRVGIKPLYFSLNEESLTFGSEIKAILADPTVKPDMDVSMLDRFLVFGYVPGEETLFKNIRKLPPGHLMSVRNGKVSIKQYWDFSFNEDPISEQEAEQRLIESLEESVKLHMISDVPVGFLLSGGVDSTAMLSLAASKTDKKISSFTVGFSEPNVIDERPFARLAAERFGSEHHEITISSKDFADWLPQYVWHMEEPVCEPPAIALHFVSKLARQYVKVLISGEGGDEAFGGYSNYRNLLWLERLKKGLGPLKSVAAKSIRSSNKLFDSWLLDKYGPLLNLPLPDYYYSRTSSPQRYFAQNWQDIYSTETINQIDRERSLSPISQLFRNAATFGSLNKMLYVDSKSWLPDDLLIKADKITMANSIELRVPLLDHKVLEFSASLPSSYKVHGFTTKYIAKKALEKHIPTEIVKRKKAGFPVPYESWLRTDMDQWVKDTLLSSKSFSRTFFKPAAMEQLIQKNRITGGYSKEIFMLAVFEIWQEQFMRPANHPPQDSQGRLAGVSESAH